jgi:hypothetical protein
MKRGHQRRREDSKPAHVAGENPGGTTDGGGGELQYKGHHSLLGGGGTRGM